MFSRLTATDSSKLHQFALVDVWIMLFKCLKLYSLNYAIAHAQLKLLCWSKFVIIVLHKAQENWLITWNKLRNQFRIYQK